MKKIFETVSVIPDKPNAKPAIIQIELKKLYALERR